MAKRKKSVSLSLGAKFVIALLVSTVVPLSYPAQQDVTWDVNSTKMDIGRSTWNISSAIWPNGTSFRPWQNQVFDKEAFAGTADVVTGGRGSLILTGVSTHTGWTIVAQSVLQIGDGGTAGSISGNVNNSSRLIFNRSDSIRCDGTISGTGFLDKAGLGMLTLPGDSGVFDGHAAIHNGVLTVNGMLGGTLHVLPHASLHGAGDIGATTVEGTVAPGNSIGTLTVHGNYVQLHGSTYEVEIDPGGANDQVIVTDLADIQGGTVSVIPAGEEFTPGSRFTILTANSGLTGKFDSLTHSLVNLGISYDPTHVYLDVLRFCDMVETPNQCATVRRRSA